MALLVGPYNDVTQAAAAEAGSGSSSSDAASVLHNSRLRFSLPSGAPGAAASGLTTVAGAFKASGSGGALAFLRLVRCVL
jgi:hypothetical protein